MFRLQGLLLSFTFAVVKPKAATLCTLEASTKSCENQCTTKDNSTTYSTTACYCKANRHHRGLQAGKGSTFPQVWLCEEMLKGTNSSKTTEASRKILTQSRITPSLRGMGLSALRSRDGGATQGSHSSTAEGSRSPDSRGFSYRGVLADCICIKFPAMSTFC